MHPVLPRVRLGLYAVVVLALITSAVIALVSLGTRSGSGATAAQQPTAAVPSRTAPASPIHTPGAGTSHPARKVTHTTGAGTGRATSGSRMSGAAQSAHAATRPAKVYTVKRGDNLTVIAAWFHVRGYEPLYAWNKTIIGRNPDLIFPGQKIVVVPGRLVNFVV